MGVTLVCPEARGRGFALLYSGSNATPRTGRHTNHRRPRMLRAKADHTQARLLVRLNKSKLNCCLPLRQPQTRFRNGPLCVEVPTQSADLVRGKQTRQCTYNVKNEVHSRSHCCRGKAVSIKIWLCVCNLGYPPRYAHASYYTVICGVSVSTIVYIIS